MKGYKDFIKLKGNILLNHFFIIFALIIQLL